MIEALCKTYQELQIDLSYPLGHDKASLVEWCENVMFKTCPFPKHAPLVKMKVMDPKPYVYKEVYKNKGQQIPRYIYTREYLYVSFIHTHHMYTNLTFAPFARIPLQVSLQDLNNWKLPGSLHPSMAIEFQVMWL